MEKVALVGAKGTIGTALRKGLSGFELVSVDLPEADARDIAVLKRHFEGCAAAINLAWDLKTDNWDTGRISPDNALITYNVYQAALDSGVKRVIVASSVHADSFMDWDRAERMRPYTLPRPTSPYGANKVLMEAMGSFYSTKGLEVVCVRFGAVNKDDRPSVGAYDWRKVWFSHRDLAGLITACLKSGEVPGRYAIVYGVSRNRMGVNDWSNPFGWAPLDDAYSVLP